VSQDRSVLQRMTQLYPQMSPSQQRIADTILQDPETAAFYTVSELASRAGVSDSTVTRFAAFLGYSGFPALSRELQERVRSRLTTSERFRLSRTAENDDQQRVLQYLEEDMQNLSMLMERLDLAAFARTVDALAGARKIGIVCARSSVSLGLFLEFYLNLLGKEAVLFTGEPRTVDRLQHIGKEDVLIGIGFARYSRFTVTGLQYGRKKGVRTLALTDTPSSPLVPHADEVLFTPTGIASHMDSFVAPLSLITALLRALANHLPAQAGGHLQALEDVWQMFDTYSDPVD
jgi:DNA-binding MurR/RpiR family transcriptional regulator